MAFFLLNEKESKIRHYTASAVSDGLILIPIHLKIINALGFIKTSES